MASFRVLLAGLCVAALMSALIGCEDETAKKKKEAERASLAIPVPDVDGMFAQQEARLKGPMPMASKAGPTTTAPEAATPADSGTTPTDAGTTPADSGATPTESSGTPATSTDTPTPTDSTGGTPTP